MPGLSLLFSQKSIDESNAQPFSKTLNEMRFFSGYNSKCLYRGQNIIIGFSGYENYPISKYEFGNHIIFLEGKIYNMSAREISRRLQLISEDAFDRSVKDSALEQLFAGNLTDLDGEFWIIITDKPGQKAAIINDPLGKLPLYYNISSDKLTVSREIAFVRRLNDADQYDRIGISQFLMYRYTFGEKTIFSRIKRFPFGSFLKISAENPRKRPIRYKEWDISESQRCGPINLCAAELFDKAVNAVRERGRIINNKRSIIALSGGLDSRSVLGVLKAVDSNILAASSADFNGSNYHDVEIAGIVANSQKIDFMKVNLEKPRFDDYEKIASIKPGLNHVIMANALGLYRALEARFPLGTDFYTGDGGASIKTPYRTQGKIFSKESMIRQIFYSASIFDNETLKRLLNIEISELIMDFENIIENYPAIGWKEKYFYHIVFDYLTNFGYEGEDRSRYFFWTQTPFESIPLYIDALRIPDKYKSRLKLINMFLKQCNPSLLEIEYADYGGRPNSARVLFALTVKDFVKKHRRLLQGMRRIIHPQSYRPQPIEPGLLDFARNRLHCASNLSDVMDIDYMERLLEKPMSKARFNILFSLILAEG